MLRCRQCGLVYLDHLPSENALRDFYSEHYYFDGGYQDYIAEKPFIQLNGRARLREIVRMRGTGRLLEIGCALGFFLEEARKAGFDVNGVEISPYGSRYAREELGLPVMTGTLESCDYPKSSFDVVVMWDVIEHLAYPRKVLKRVGELMKPDGLLVFTTVDAGSLYARLMGKGWHLYDIPEHLVYYDRRTVQKALDDTGFAACRITNNGNRYAVGYMLYRLEAMYGKRFFRPLRSACERLRLAHAIVPVNLGDLMTVYARPKTRR